MLKEKIDLVSYLARAEGLVNRVKATTLSILWVPHKYLEQEMV